MEGLCDDSLTKELLKKLKKTKKQMLKEIEAEPTCTTEGATKPETKGMQVKGICTTEGAIEGQSAKKFKVPHEPLGKRVGSPNPSQSKQDLKKKKKLEDGQTQDVAKPGSSKENGVASNKNKKKKKLENSQTQDVAKPGSSKENGLASNKNKNKKKKKQEPEAFNALKSPPSTSKGKASAAPTTPQGIPPQKINPIYTPARPKGVSRVIKDDDAVEEASDWEYEDNESDTDSSSEADSEDSAGNSSENEEETSW